MLIWLIGYWGIWSFEVPKPGIHPAFKATQKPILGETNNQIPNLKWFSPK